MSGESRRTGSIRLDRRPPRAVFALLAVLVGLLLAACVAGSTPTPGASATTSTAPSPTASAAGGSPGASPGATTAPCPNPTPGPGPSQVHNLCPASPGTDPLSLISWIFTPIFQGLFLGLAVLYKILGDIGLAIVALTLLIRILLVPVFRAQIVSQRRMQLLQPELRALQQKHKGDRARVSQEQMNLYKERGVNPASGCLPALVTLVLLIPMYSVFSQGLTAPDISSMLHVFGVQVIDIQCQAPGTLQPCINPTVHWLPDPHGGLLQANRPEILFTIPGIGFGVSLLALISAFLQLIQTRMMTPRTNDPQVLAQQRVFLILPLFSIFYGSFLPAGLFLYWIVTTVFSIVQQYLIAGWGSLFPLFGWTPGFAQEHQPRFPVQMPSGPPPASGDDKRAAPTRDARSAADRAAGTVRPSRQRGRTSRRGRRR
jgi:YidC/Oxa1 family membrane protein insertase